MGCDYVQERKSHITMLRAHSVSCNQAPCKVHAKLYVPVLGTNKHINKDELSTFPLGPRES